MQEHNTHDTTEATEEHRHHDHARPNTLGRGVREIFSPSPDARECTRDALTSRDAREQERERFTTRAPVAATTLHYYCYVTYRYVRSFVRGENVTYRYVGLEEVIR